MRASLLLSSLTAILCLASTCRAEPNVHDTRLLTYPAVSARQVAFVYADDLWIADLDGRNVRRLTSDIGVESHPLFSPDGKTLAFSAQYDGNTDVYTIPVEGGAPTRLTWHPDQDIARGWTPNGKAVLFSSARNAYGFSNRLTQLFTLPASGGMPTQLPIPHGVEASYSPDGEFIAYTPLGDRTGQWKHYRGGTHSRIWIYRCKDHQVKQIPQPEGRCNDLDPNWLGETIYFRSDRDGEYNVYAFDTGTRNISKLTNHDEFPVLDISAGGGHLIYEQAGYLHLLDPQKKQSTRLSISVATDLVEARPRFVKGAKYIRHAQVSPSGARTVFEFRGEIVTVPAEKGDPRNLTNTPGAHERWPAWSPDGQSIAYFSDEGGEYQLHVQAATGHGQAKSYPLGGAGFYEEPVWSPDSKKLAFVDNSLSLFWIDLDSGKVTKIASEPQYGPPDLRTLRPAWSPDSQWLVYALGNKAMYHTLYAYHLAKGETKALTDGLSDALDPVFDASGKYLYFFGSTDAGPVNQWFVQSNADMRSQRSLYLIVLKKGVPSPLMRESDEEKPREDKKEAPDKSKNGKEGDKSKSEPVVIDFSGLDQRILALPVPPGEYRNLQAGSAGQMYYLEESPKLGATSPLETIVEGPRDATLKHFDLTKRKSEQITKHVRAYQVTADHKKALVFHPPESWSIISLSEPATAGKGKLKIDAIEVRIDPRAEWAQIFDEAWRINRDYFYDPAMHGADWPAIKRKYAVFLLHLATRGDLDRVLRWMLSELAVGHSGTAPGERLHDKKSVPGGLLGADYEIANERYRLKKVYGGLNWNPELRAPLTVPGVDVKAGEYLLAVRGIALKPPTSLYSLFENTANKSIEITVGPNPDGKDSRTVTVEPLASEAALRNCDWVEGNLKKVHRATGGRVAYVYVPDTYLNSTALSSTPGTS